MTSPSDAPEKGHAAAASASLLIRFLGLALPVRYAEAICHYYRLDAPLAPSQKCPALQREVAKPMRISRERARQLIARSHGILAAAFQSPPPLLRSIVDDSIAYLNALGGTLRRDAALPRPPPPEFGAASPYAVLLLLSEFVPQITAYRDFLTLAPPATAEAAELFLLARLRAATSLQPIDELADSAPSELATALPPGHLPALLKALALVLPDITLTHDGRVALTAVAGPELLAELLSARPDASLPVLRTAYNLLVPPEAQIGQGHLLAFIHASDAFEKTTPGHYRLRRPHQPPLPR